MPKFVTANLSNNAEPCILRYTTSDNEMLDIKADRFDAEIISHIYNNGEGQVIFNKPICTIGYYAFGICSNLTCITIPDSVTEIGEGAFNGCSNLTSITIPNSVTEIGKCAFSNCSSLTSITIPDSVTEIGYKAFSGCSSLTSVTIPDSVTNIGGSVFSRCSSLTAFYSKFASADNRCLIVDGELDSFAPAGLTEYTIPNSVTSIGDAFFGCSHLTSITIPNSVTVIGRCAFSYCSSLASVTM